jgi:aminoglycoside phosphotransferase (APT) family kinase protein
MDLNIENISDSRKCKQINVIDRGYSGEKKYCIETFEGDKYLLRLADLSQYDRKKTEFETLKDLKEINFTRPLHIGTYDKKNVAFTIYTWVEGNDLAEVLPELDEQEQYQLGYQSGLILNEFHKIEAPSEIPRWQERCNSKLDRKIKKYQECEVKVEGAQAIMDYLDKNRDLLNSRPQTFLHGDYHVGNMVLNENKSIGIIDFNRYDYGDPWEDFNKITSCAEMSPAFASGQLDGYFDNNIPDEFWRLLALYIGSNQLAYIPWAMERGNLEIGKAVKQIKDVLNWYDGYCEYIPSWYKKQLK